MWTPAQATVARMLIEQHLAPRREAVRKAMIRILLDAGADPRPSVNDTLARVHDLCAKELAERVRIAADELKKAYASGPETSTHILLEDLRQEIELCVSDELSDLVGDELLAKALIDHLPKFLADPRPTSL